MNFDYALSVCTQLVCENNDLSSTLKIAEITNGPTDDILISKISKVIETEPYVQVNFVLFSYSCVLAIVFNCSTCNFYKLICRRNYQFIQAIC